MTATRSRGRRPGSPDTRAAILDSARDLFAENGFGGTSIRAIAAAAGVDPALVHHYFSSKDDLFVATLALPVDPRELLAVVATGGPDGAGERLVRMFLSAWDDPGLRPGLVGAARALLDPASEALVRDGFLTVVIGPLGEALGLDDPGRRMPLVASQMIGLVLLRYVLRVEPLASMPGEHVVAIYGPTLQRYLTGDLPGA